MITPNENEALRDFAAVARELAIPFLLIGAGARLMLLDWKRSVVDRRYTEDWDFGVQLTDWESFDRLRRALIASGRFEVTTVLHRVQHRSNVNVDFVPFGDLENPEGSIVWGDQDRRMNVYGFREALDNILEMQLDDELSIPVVSMPGFVILKIFSCNDRDGNKRLKDVQDIYVVLKTYHEIENEERTYLLLGNKIAEGEIIWDMAGAYLLGKDVADIILVETYTALMPIIRSLYADEDTPVNRLIDTRHLTEEEEASTRKEARQFFETFARGLTDNYPKQLKK